MEYIYSTLSISPSKHTTKVLKRKDYCIAEVVNTLTERVVEIEIGILAGLID